MDRSDSAQYDAKFLGGSRLNVGKMLGIEITSAATMMRPFHNFSAPRHREAMGEFSYPRVRLLPHNESARRTRCNTYARESKPENRGKVAGGMVYVVDV